MTGKTFVNAVGNSEMDILQLLLEILAETRSDYCVIGGLAVNAYAEPVVSLDLDVIVTADKVDEVGAAAKNIGMKVEEFEHSLILSSRKSGLRKIVHHFVCKLACAVIAGSRRGKWSL